MYEKSQLKYKIFRLNEKTLSTTYMNLTQKSGE